MTDAVTSTAAAALGPKPEPASADALSDLSNDYETFLQLLTAQVQYQDPLEPMDSSTFVSQLAQLSQVEQSVAVNQNLEGIAAQLSTSTAMSEVGMIGREVLTAGDAFAASADGTTRLAYELSGETETVLVRILDEGGQVVRTLGGQPTAAGEWHELLWDGMTDNGKAAAGESFTFEVEALDAEGDSVGTKTYVPGIVESVILDAEEPLMVLDNGAYVTSANIVEVS